MADCEFNNITNQSEYEIMYVKLEDRNDNRIVAANGGSVPSGSWLPKVSSADDFLKKVSVVLSMGDQRVLGYMWQRDSDRIVRMSETGYDADASPLPGKNSGKITLTITKQGKLRGD